MALSRDLVLTAGRVVPRRARPRRGCAANTGGGKRTTLLQHVGCSAPPRRRRGDSISRASRSDLGRVSCSKPRQTTLARFFCRETCRKKSRAGGSGTLRFSRPRRSVGCLQTPEIRLSHVRHTEDMIDIPIEGFVETQFDRKCAAARRTSRRAELGRTRDRPKASAMGRSAQREEAVAEASFARYMKPVRFGRPDLPRPTCVLR